jgi:hypothetical protein
MPPKFDLSKIISLLEKSPIVSTVDVLLADEIEKRSFHKIRCALIPSRYKLDIKFIKTETEFLYSYQLYADRAIARWDNEPHYPYHENFPHHFHYKGKVHPSALSGNAIWDIRPVLTKIIEIIAM